MDEEFWKEGHKEKQKTCNYSKRIERGDKYGNPKHYPDPILSNFPRSYVNALLGPGRLFQKLSSGLVSFINNNFLPPFFLKKEPKSIGFTPPYSIMSAKNQVPCLLRPYHLILPLLHCAL